MNQPASDSTCLNCHQPLLGNFCHHCGQSASVERMTFHDTLSDFFSASFALDGPLLRTTRLLVIQPATILREFTEGRRKSYYKPVAYFVLLTAIYILLRSLIGYDPFNERMDQMQANDQVNTNLLQEAGIYMFKNINNILFLLLFGMALSFKLFFPKRFLLA